MWRQALPQLRAETGSVADCPRFRLAQMDHLPDSDLPRLDHPDWTTQTRLLARLLRSFGFASLDYERGSHSPTLACGFSFV